MPAGAADAWAELSEQEQAAFRDLKVGETTTFIAPDKCEYRLKLVEHVWSRRRNTTAGLNSNTRSGFRQAIGRQTNEPEINHHDCAADPELRAKESRRRSELRWKWDAAKHIRTMRIRGLPLLLTYRNGTPHWRLGDIHIETGAAELIIRNPQHRRCRRRAIRRHTLANVPLCRTLQQRSAVIEIQLEATRRLQQRDRSLRSTLAVRRQVHESRSYANGFVVNYCPPKRRSWPEIGTAATEEAAKALAQAHYDQRLTEI